MGGLPSNALTLDLGVFPFSNLARTSDPGLKPLNSTTLLQLNKNSVTISNIAFVKLRDIKKYMSKTLIVFIGAMELN